MIYFFRDNFLSYVYYYINVYRRLAILYYVMLYVFLENSKKKSEKIWLFQEKAVPLHSLLRDTLNKQDIHGAHSSVG